MSVTEATSRLADNAVSPSVTNPDGSEIVGELCFNGKVVSYAGLGLTLAYGNAPDATPESGTSSATPFDAHTYSGVSFYFMVVGADAAPLPSVHFSVPDTQTADKAAWPAAACNVSGGTCDDDFGGDLTLTAANVWTKQSFPFVTLSQGGWGSAFSAIMSNQLIGMKWQVNGNGEDAGITPFNFCISDIYFTP
jgi:hypothetical protein